jgi:hypothetical protein
MKRIWMAVLWVVVLVFGGVGMANAILINNYDGTITQVRDDGSRLMWMQDANYAMTSGFDPDGQITQSGAIAWASTLTFAGYSGWRLPITYDNTKGGYLSSSEMGDLYYNGLGNSAGSFITAGPFINIKDYWYWTSIDYAPEPFVMVFSFLNIPLSPFNEAGWQDAGDKYATTYAWLVRDLSPVPLPSTMLLLGSGLLGLAGWRRLKKG